MTFNAQTRFDLPLVEPKLAARECETVSIAGRSLKTTPVFYAYWQFAAERQRIFYRRLARANGSLTDDPILKLYKFTNSYRASDRVSQFLIRNVIYRSDLPSDDTNLFFRILLFKLFNKIETWKALEERLGAITWETFSFANYDAVLSDRMATGDRVYSAAYIMPSGGTAFGHKQKHRNHLSMVADLVSNDFPSRLTKCRQMADGYKLLLSVPSIGPFLAYQFVTDLNYSTLTNFSEDEFVVAGPGAIDGINKCFLDIEDVDPSDIIKYMRDRQAGYFTELGIDFLSLWGRPLQLIDCQNLFCEISKYSRVAFPEYGGVAGRTRIKQKFSLSDTLPSPWYPPKWNLNSKIEDATSAYHQDRQ